MASSTPPHTSRTSGDASTGRILQTALSVAFLLATLFTGFSPKMFSVDLGSIIYGVLTPQPGSGVDAPTTLKPLRIGIVSGHWGNGSDAGAVCPDGTNEHDVNLAIASLVRQKLEARGYNIDLLQEFDPRLDSYQAALLLSIHSDTCDVVDPQATGFKVAASTYSHDQNLAGRLTACLYDRYGSVTGLSHHTGSITLNMTDYHAFRVIDTSTPAAIIETGFLNLDRDLLVNHPDVVADGIVAGVLCFVRSESVQPTPTMP
jgi:N-acetylmuramoyl-L-alanine amidase